MNAPLASSPVHDVLAKAVGANLEQGRTLTLGDLSLRPRAGVKGPQAESWLADLGVTPPAAINSWQELPQGGLIARLGRNEFLIDGNAAAVEAISAASRAPGVYPVLRQDACFVIGGSRVGALWRQTCNVDFRQLEADPFRVLMTSLVGVSVTVVLLKGGAAPFYRLWCDGTYGHYLWETLTELASEMGGGIDLDPAS